MSDERWQRLERLFEAAVALEIPARSVFVSQCADEDLRADLQNLLEAHDRVGGFLDQPAIRWVETSESGPASALSPGQVLRDRYRIGRLLGKGGMGEVYEAEDLALRCPIAVKTLRAGLPLGRQARERFKREIVLGRQISHPNVCRVHDLDSATAGPDGEVLFLTMELLRGETLSQRLRRDGPLTLSEARPIAANIIAGLEACHRYGVVHRDLKSSNVILVAEQDRGAVITDFGLAHSVRGESGDGQRLTGPGAVMGTPGYMAPEQRAGRPATAASDIYALGVTLCEMLTGRLPEPGRLPADGPPLNPPWSSAILRCIQTEPADRFQDTREVARALDAGYVSAGGSEERTEPPGHGVRWKRLVVAAALVLAILFAAWGAYRRMHALPEQKHVAVLAFRNLGNDPADQLFCEGLVETLASKLSQLERYQASFWVVPAIDSRRISSPQEAHRKLDATIVVTGSLKHGAGKAVLNISVIDARTHRQLDSRTVETTTAGLSGFEDRAWESVAEMLDLQLRPDQVRSLEAGKARVPEAYVSYTLGLAYLRRNGLENIDEAIARFRDAVQRDPSYALPYSALGSAYALRYEVTKDPAWLDLARSNAARGVELAPELASAHFTTGQIAYATGRDEDAKRELTAALKLDPGVIEARYYLGRLYNRQGKVREAEREFTDAVARRPGYWRGHSELGVYYNQRGRFAEAEREFLEVLRLEPADLLALTNLSAMYMAGGRFEEAARILENEIRLSPKTAQTYSNLGACYMYLGRFQEAVQPMEAAVRLSPGSQDAWRNLGDAYRFAPGPANRAADAYRKALELGRQQLAINPREWETLASVALYEAHLNQPQQAIRDAERAMKMEPSNSEIFFTAAVTYEILGQRTASLEALKTAYSLGYAVAYIEREPELAAVRADARYRTWIQRSRPGSQ